MAQVTYFPAEKGSTFQFTLPDGSTAVVDAKGYSTSDAGQIAYLNACAFVTAKAADDPKEG